MLLHYPQYIYCSKTWLCRIWSCRLYKAPFKNNVILLGEGWSSPKYYGGWGYTKRLHLMKHQYQFANVSATKARIFLSFQIQAKTNVMNYKKKSWNSVRQSPGTQKTCVAHLHLRLLCTALYKNICSSLLEGLKKSYKLSFWTWAPLADEIFFISWK